MSKKIVVVTVYNSENCGSYLQAYAMQTILKRKGYEVYFLHRSVRKTSLSVYRHVLSSVKALLKFKYKDIWFIWYSWIEYKKVRRIFSTCKFMSKEYEDADYVLIGSDTIWNFESPYFVRKAKVYLGNVFPGKYVITYAVSVANTSAKLFEKIVQTNGGIKNVKSFLVRDLYTKKIVEQETSENIHIVTDPTLLLEKEVYSSIASPINEDKPYILLYYFGDIKDDIKKALLEYASKNDLKIVSLLKHREWCDVSIPPNPHKIIGYFKNAKAVITNTYHGSIFSMIFEKPFAVHDEGKRKVNDILEKYNEEDRLFFNANAIHELFEKQSSIFDNGLFDSIRIQSMQLLETALQIKTENYEK